MAILILYESIVCIFLDREGVSANTGVGARIVVLSEVPGILLVLINIHPLHHI